MRVVSRDLATLERERDRSESEYEQGDDDDSEVKVHPLKSARPTRARFSFSFWGENWVPTRLLARAGSRRRGVEARARRLARGESAQEEARPEERRTLGSALGRRTRGGTALYVEKERVKVPSQK